MSPLPPASFSQKPQVRNLIRVILGVTVLAVIMAAAIAWRVAHREVAPGFFPILGWQLGVWVPWIGYYYVVRFLVRRLGTYQDATPMGLLMLVLAALLIAITHLVWFWWVSSNFSPFLGAPNTRFGAFAFFFVFWFLIDLLLFWAIFVRPEPMEDQNAEATGTATTERFAVRTGRSQHLVRATDIRWIEAQGYYAALHTDDGSFLLRRSLTRLEDELDPDEFVRVHRSTILNLSAIREMKTNENGSCTVVLTDGTCRSASRNGQRKLRTLLPEPA